MSTTQEKIQSAAARNAELLSTLSATDHAGPALAQQDRYLGELAGQKKQLSDHLSTLEKARRKELKEHEAYQRSVVKRLAFKVAGKREKFEARAEKEEREYFDAVRDEHEARQKLQSVNAMITEAEGVKANLTAQTNQHAQAQRELDALYESIFAGPTPEEPEEDARERARELAAREYADARGVVEGASRAVQLLADAQGNTRGALAAMRQALDASEWDMWGGGNMADMMERSALQQAETKVSMARSLVAHAQSMSPHVRIDGLPPVTISQGNLMGDVLFDNFFSDMAFHEKIQRSTNEVTRFDAALAQMLHGAHSQLTMLQSTMSGKAMRLEEARAALQKAREAAFERATGKH